MINAVLCFHRLHSINMKQLISLFDNTLLLNKAVIYLSFMLEGRKTQLFVICQCFLSNNTSFFRLLFFGTFSLSTHISRYWFLHWLILSFRAVSNQSVQFRFRLSLSLSLSLSLFLSLCVYLNHALFLCQVFTLSIQMFWYQKVYLHLEWTLPKEMQINGLVDVILTRLRWTYSDQSVKICYFSKYSGLVSPSQPKSRKCKVRIDPELHSFSRLYEVLCYHALENTDPAMEDALTYMQLIYPLSRAAEKHSIFKNSLFSEFVFSLQLLVFLILLVELNL